MSVSRPESFVLSLFDNIDDLTAYCMADNAGKQVIAESLIAKLQNEGNGVPGMTCDIKTRQK